MKNIKGLLFTIAVSIIIMVLLMYFVYDFDIRPLYISDTFFFVGVMFLFPGLVVITGATELFSSARYIFKKSFFKTKDGQNYFKSFGDYKEYEREQKLNHKTEFTGISILIVGAVYIILSFAIAMSI